MLAPAGTPPALIARMNAEINQLLTLPDVKEAMAKQGLDPAGGKPDRLDTLLRSEVKLWTQVVTRGKLIVD
jgi:tripartite-type tricarboxylate transporter receptor subunit TctC